MSIVLVDQKEVVRTWKFLLNFIIKKTGEDCLDCCFDETLSVLSTLMFDAQVSKNTLKVPF
jgi:hypothetical protein